MKSIKILFAPSTFASPKFIIKKRCEANQRCKLFEIVREDESIRYKQLSWENICLIQKREIIKI